MRCAKPTTVHRNLAKRHLARARTCNGDALLTFFLGVGTKGVGTKGVGTKSVGTKGVGTKGVGTKGARALELQIVT